jgi:endo-1,4-beta-xylanase
MPMLHSAMCSLKKAVDELLCWGLVDHYSWLQQFSPRADGRPLRPLPYDQEYRAKPLRTAIAEAILHAPRGP